MFGYVRVFKDELKVKDWNQYRRYYCALCRGIASYSQLHRLLLSYDMTFLVILARGCEDGGSCRIETRPKCHGSASCFAKYSDNSKLQFLSAFSILLQYYKIKDDITDGNRKKRLFMPLLKSGYTKAKNAYPKIAEIVELQMQKLHALELANCTDLVQLQECFARIFKDVFCYLPDEPNHMREILGEIACHIAAWVYLVDMFDDREQDKKEHNFNPLLQESVSISKYAIEEVGRSLLFEHMEKAKALLQVLPYYDGMPILENVISLGLPAQMQKLGLIE